MCYVNLYRFNSIIYIMWDSISRQTVRCPTSVRHPISDCPLLLRISQQHKQESFKSKYHCLDLQLFLSGIVGTSAMAQLCSISKPPACLRIAICSTISSLLLRKSKLWQPCIYSYYGTFLLSCIQQQCAYRIIRNRSYTT